MTICDQCGDDHDYTTVVTLDDKPRNLCGPCLSKIFHTRELSGNLAKPVNQAVTMPVAEVKSDA